MFGKITRKRVLCSVLLLFTMFLFAACNKEDEAQTTENEYQIYYCNSEETELVGVPYQASSTATNDLIHELMEAMEKEPKSLKYKKVKPDAVKLLTFETNDNQQLTMHFSKEYTGLSGVPEILFRAAVVKMMCQIEDVEYVEFYIEDQPLMKTVEKPYGFMTADDFIDNTGKETNFSQNVTMSLYFANEKGDGLKEVRVNVKYDGTVSLEQLIIQRLIDGPSAIEGLDEDIVQATIPKGTVIQKTSVRDNVCYVYFNSELLAWQSNITDEVAIYSIVNSLCEMSTISKVQFMIDGSTVATYHEKIPFDGFFERNLDLVEY